MNYALTITEDNNSFPADNHSSEWDQAGLTLWQLNLDVVQVMISPKGKPYAKTSKQSFRRIGATMNEVFRDKGLQVTLPNILDYLNEMKERVKPNTFATCKNAIKQLVLAQPVFQNKYQVRQKILEFFKESFLPVTVVRAMDEDKYLSYEQYEQLIQFGRDENNVPRFNPNYKKWGPRRWEEKVVRNRKMSLMIEALFQSASRVSAFLNIKLTQCNFTSDGQYRILLAYDKGHKSRDVYIKEDLAKEILATFKSKVYLFENERGKKIHRSNFAKQLEDYAKSAGLADHVNPHKLRHTFAMARIYGKRAKEGGRTNVTAKDVQDVSIYLGHSDVETTYKYYLNKQFNRANIHDIPE